MQFRHDVATAKPQGQPFFVMPSPELVYFALVDIVDTFKTKQRSNFLQKRGCFRLGAGVVLGTMELSPLLDKEGRTRHTANHLEYPIPQMRGSPGRA